MERDVRGALGGATEDQAVRVIILTGAGRGYCAGADMAALSGITDHAGRERPDDGVPVGPIDGGLDVAQDFCRRRAYYPTAPRPIIAAINGPCAGIGLVPALYADLRFASDAAVITTAVARPRLHRPLGIRRPAPVRSARLPFRGGSWYGLTSHGRSWISAGDTMTTAELDFLIGRLRDRAAERPATPTVQEMRDGFDELANILPTPADARVEPVDAGGVAAEMIAAPGADAARLILYLHGGGYVIGSLNSHRTLAYDLSKAAGARLLNVDYRLAPEHPFPAAVDDAVAAYRWLLESGAHPATTVIGGDSAGGGLTVATMVALKDAGLPMPAAGVCLSPWVDMEGLGDSMDSKAEADPLVQRDAIEWFAGLYLNGADPKSPLAAPLYADLTGLPALLIQVGTAETLLDDSVALAKRAEAAGVAVTFDIWENMIHVWHLFAPMLSEGREAIVQAGAFIRERTS